MASVEPVKMHPRSEYWHDPGAPAPNSLVPAAMLLVIRDDGRLLLQRRRDTSQWAIPGGKQELGESVSACAIRECEEETGIKARITGVLGIYSDPEHIVEYTSDGEVRQEYEVTLLGTPTLGQPTKNDEASEVEWVAPDDLDSYDIHPTMQRQLDDYLSGRYPVVV